MSDHRESFKNLMNLGIQIYTNDETVEHLKIITGELMKGVPEKRPFRVGSFTVLFATYYKGQGYRATYSVFQLWLYRGA